MPIRLATVDDLPALMALERQAPTAAHWSGEQYQSLFNGTPDRIILVLEEESTVQGFLVARTLEQEFEIENIVVAISARQRGLGTALLRELLHRARRRGVEAIHLEVRESNVAARALYSKCSFRQTGWRTSYYRDPEEDGAIFRLDLTS